MLGGEQKGASLSSGTIRTFEIIGLVILLLIVAASIPWFIARRTYMQNQNVTFAQRLEEERELHAQAMEKLKQASELATLMQLNQEQIDTYHRIVTGQADKSFKSSRIAMSLGMLLLVGAAVAGAWVPFEQVRWFIGGLATLSTLLSGYLNRTYLTLYKESIGQLNRYFDQPVLNGYHLAAERIAGKLGEQHQDEVRKQIITKILDSGPQRLDTKVEPKEQKPNKRRPKRQTASLNGSPHP
ncbi:hypothetical protein ACFWBM_35100 [Streptomyces sp. NPDC059980]|uniref:hypothetical protein n=1 Tax=Streptomyces sp. NPDC059980 TaxID=3347022 RepID=UPI00367C3C38